MILEKRIIKCSKCNAVFSVSNPNRTERLRVNCYNGECTNVINVVFDDGKTSLPETADFSNMGKFITQSQEISLDEDWVNKKFTLGRATTEGDKPDVGIVTSDRSMSRKHCYVEIKKLSSGKVKTIISDARAIDKIEKRPLEINGIKLFPIDLIVLCDGDNIKMGDTIVSFSQK